MTANTHLSVIIANYSYSKWQLYYCRVPEEVEGGMFVGLHGNSWFTLEIRLARIFGLNRFYIISALFHSISGESVGAEIVSGQRKASQAAFIHSCDASGSALKLKLTG